VRETHPKVVEELIPDLLTLGGVGKVLQNLLKEQIPIRDLVTILETLADWSPVIKDLDVLTEYVRQALARTITRLYTSPEQSIYGIVVDQSVENIVSGWIRRTEQGNIFAVDPAVAQEIVRKVSDVLERTSSLNWQSVVLCSAEIRRHFKRLIERFIPNLVVLSYNDILSDVKIEHLGTVELPDAD